MYIIQYALLGWLSFASAGKYLGEECKADSDCFSQHCRSVCDSDDSISRCIEAKSFFTHLNIEEDCVSQLDAEILGRKVPGSTLEFGNECDGHGSCFSGHCVPICEQGTTGTLRCIEPVYSFSRHSKPIPTCITEHASLDHLQLHNNASSDEAKLKSETSVENVGEKAEPIEDKPSNDEVSSENNKQNIEPLIPNEDIALYDESPIPDFIIKKNVGYHKKFPGQVVSHVGTRTAVRVAGTPVTNPADTSLGDGSLPQFIIARSNASKRDNLRSRLNVRSEKNI